MNCRHCSSNSGPSCNARLGWQTIDQLLDQAVLLGAKQISFGGGEPTLAPCFADAVRGTLSRRLSAEVFTCGSVFGARGRITSIPITLLRGIKQIAGNLTFVFSFHGSSSSVHDSMTGIEGSFACLMESLKRCLESGIHCTANLVPTKVNAFELQSIVGLLDSIKIPKLSVLRFVPQGRGLVNQRFLELDREEEDSFIEDLLHLRPLTAVEIRTGSPFNGIVPDNNVPCRAGHQKLVVQATGNVLPCEVFKHHGRSDWGASVCEHSLGMIMKSQSFVSLRKSLLEGHCAMCPVHGMLREKQLHSGAFHGTSQAGT